MSLNRKVRDLCDSIGGTSFGNPDLNPKCNLTSTDNGNEEEIRSSLDINEQGKYDDRSISIPYSEPGEEAIFFDVRSEDRICAQCRQDHSFKQNFKEVRTSIECIPELIFLIFRKDYDTTYSQALACRHCNTAVVAKVTIVIYNYDLYVEDQKVKHRHPADPETVGDILKCVSTEVDF